MWLAEIIILITFALAMGWVGRMDGGAPPKTPEWFERYLAMSPILALGAAVHPLFAFPSFAGVIAIITGHGQYFLSRVIKAIKPEKIDFIVRLFFGRDPRTDEKFKDFRGINTKDLSEADALAIKTAMEEYGLDRLYWRNVTGMTILGFILTLPVAIILIIKGFPFAAILALAAGMQKGLSYMAGYALSKTEITHHLPAELQEDTAIGEFFNRFLMTVFLYLSFKAMGLS